MIKVSKVTSIICQGSFWLMILIMLVGCSGAHNKSQPQRRQITVNTEIAKSKKDNVVQTNKQTGYIASQSGEFMSSSHTKDESVASIIKNFCDNKERVLIDCFVSLLETGTPGYEFVSEDQIVLCALARALSEKNEMTDELDDADWFRWVLINAQKTYAQLDYDLNNPRYASNLSEKAMICALIQDPTFRVIFCTPFEGEMKNELIFLSAQEAFGVFLKGEKMPHVIVSNPDEINLQGETTSWTLSQEDDGSVLLRIVDQNGKEAFLKYLVQ